MKEGIKTPGPRMSAAEISAFCFQLELILSAGISLDAGIYLMIESPGRDSEKRILEALAQETESGVPLYHAMEENGGFPEYLINMVRIGEESGRLEQIMNLMSAYYKKEDQINQMIKEAVVYPMVMVFIMLTALFLLLGKVMPLFENVLIQLGGELSSGVRNVIAFSKALTGFFIGFLAVLSFVYFLLRFLDQRNKRFFIVEKGKEIFFKRSRILNSLEAYRFCNVVSIMLRSGIDVRKALDLSGTVAGNRYIEEKAAACRETYEKTSDFVEALKGTGFFSGFHRQMLVIGAKTGRLDEVLGELAEYYGEETEAKVRAALGKLEPAIVAALSGAVGFILLAVMVPLIKIMLLMG